MKFTFPLIFFFLCSSCKFKQPIGEINLIPNNSQVVVLKLADSLGYIELCVPKRYDTLYQWTNWSDCGKPCAKIEYRFQPKNLAVFMESGFFWSEPKKDTIERFTIHHSAYIPFQKNKEENYIKKVHERFRKSLEMSPATHDISFDTIQKVNDRYFWIFVVDNKIKLTNEYSKQVIAATTIMGNGVEFKYELLTKSRDSIYANFIKNSMELLKTIKISNGI